MKILQLCHKPPAPPKDGGCIAMNNITAGLIKAGHEVRVLTIYTHKHDLELEKLSKEYLEATKIQGVHVDTRVNLVDAFSSLITQDSYNISRFFSADYDIKLSKILKKQKFDVVHLESLFMTPYIATIRRYSKAKVVLRSHNLEYIIWERVAEGTKNQAKKAYLKYLSKKLKDYELNVITQMDGIVSISEEDAEKYRSLGLKKPLINIPFGIDLEKYSGERKSSELALFHLGAMDWRPNIEGLLWFLDEVWPKVHEAYPDLKLYLAGRNMPDMLLNSAFPQVHVLGEVPSAIDFMNSKQIMIVPLLSAGGIRVKIIEGMALKRNVISTSIGAEGINATPGRDLQIADTSQQFLSAIAHLLAEEQVREKQGENARKLVEERFDNEVLTQELIRFYKELIS